MALHYGLLQLLEVYPRLWWISCKVVGRENSRWFLMLKYRFQNEMLLTFFWNSFIVHQTRSPVWVKSVTRLCCMSFPISPLCWLWNKGMTCLNNYCWCWKYLNLALCHRYVWPVVIRNNQMHTRPITKSFLSKNPESESIFRCLCFCSKQDVRTERRCGGFTWWNLKISDFIGLNLWFWYQSILKHIQYVIYLYIT